MDIENALKEMIADDSAAIISVDFAKAVLKQVREYEGQLNTAENELIELRAKLCAMGGQEPVAWVTSRPDIFYFTTGRESAERWRKGGWKVDPLYAKPVPAAKPAARITEHDAREIALSVLLSSGFVNGRDYIDSWLNREGRALLNRLNADREQVPAAAAESQEPVYFWKEIGETDWMECGKDWYWKCVDSPEHDTKLLYDKPAVAVPKYVTVSQVPNSQYAKGWNDCVDYMLAAAPSHSQQSVDLIDEFATQLAKKFPCGMSAGDVFAEAESFKLDHCPSHESEQGGAV